jgi:hypothetical protein
MAISITKAEIKRKCRISSSDTTYDSDIDALISEMQPSIEYTIASMYLNDTLNTNLQATLKLGILEVMSGEFLQQISREYGSSETLSIGGVSIGTAPKHGEALIEQGLARLRPFRKAIDGLSDEVQIASTTSNVERTFTSDTMKVW